MNKILFDCVEEERCKIELGDILYLNGKRLVVCLLQNRKVGLIDIDNLLVCNVEFESLKYLTTNILNRKVDGDVIYASANYEWIIYFP